MQVPRRHGYDLGNLPLLGRGAFGSVYKLDDWTALKVIDVADDLELKNKALDEIELMIKLMRSGSDH